MSNRRRDRPARRAEDRNGATAVELTQQFIEDVNKKLDRLEQMLWGRWLLVVVSLILAGGTAFYVNGKLSSDRGDAVAVRCAILSAVGQAGRNVIAGSSQAPPKRQEQALQRLGFPPFAVRHTQAEREAQQYVRDISTRVHQQIGHKGDGLVNVDGTINCRKLAKISGVSLPR